MGKRKTNAMKNKARAGIEWASLDTASYCPRKRQSEAFIFSKGSTVPTSHVRVEPGLEINPSPQICLLPPHLGQELVCSLHSVIHRLALCWSSIAHVTLFNSSIPAFRTRGMDITL